VKRPPCAYSKKVEIVVDHLSLPYLHFFEATPMKRFLSPYLELDKVASFTFPKAGLKAKASPAIQLQRFTSNDFK
jgi:hypothetical protein